jgi:predicted O-methyltransferase YrrM
MEIGIVMDSIRDTRLSILAQGLTDRGILGPALQDCDRTADWIENVYTWLYAIAAVVQPRSIAEIGVRYGYSAVALLHGARHATSYYGFDNETYVPGSLRVAAGALQALPAAGDAASRLQWCLVRCNTQREERLLCAPVDLFNVDGDHTEAGCLHDLHLAHAATRPGGWIVVDDYDYHPEVRRAVQQFIVEHDCAWGYLPTYRGAIVLGRG